MVNMTSSQATRMLLKVNLSMTAKQTARIVSNLALNPQTAQPVLVSSVWFFT